MSNAGKLRTNLTSRVTPAGLFADIALGLMSGYVGTKVMEPVGTRLYEMESRSDREQEDRVRPGSPYQIAAEKTTRLIGLNLGESGLEKAGMAFHYGLGMSWGPVYTLLRRFTSINPVLGGCLAGATMWALIDEGMTPALGFSAPNREYPVATHVRALVAHLVFGLGVAAFAETVLLLGRTGGARP